MKYNHQKIERKWQKKWEKDKAFAAKFPSKQPKWYSLIEFPYPSGDGLHVGHIRSNTAMDVISRKRRMEGYNVLYPIGWDAFGLPTENYAIKTGIAPQVATKKNTDTFRRQLKSLGFSFDWDREINTTDPEYYKWTQWMFLKFFEQGLAYKAKTFINWCPKDKIGLANEEAAGGVCDRCGGPVEKREKEQWMIKITAYADKLLEGLKEVDYIPQAKIQQENWIGRSEGAEIEFPILKISSDSRVIIVHGSPPKDKRGEQGYRTEDQEHWMPWIKKKLEENSIETTIPLMPSPWEPSYEKWKKAFETLPIDEKSILIGHSAGAAFLVRWLGEKKIKIKKLILIAPGKKLTEDNKRLHQFYTFEIDRGIRDRVDEIIIFVSDNDYSHFSENATLYQTELNARLIELKNRGHFDLWHMGTDAFPELLNEILPHIKVFTTRPDTIFGVTYLVLAPEHPWLEEQIRNPKSLPRRQAGEIRNKFEIIKYINTAKNKTEIERTEEGKEKTGVELKGVKAINPANKEEIPIWVADYILAGYGTGAIMAVPQHDERDREFATKFSLPIVDRPLVSWEEALKATGGKKTVKYKLRDWVFSRQRYWGEPIPLVFCPVCKTRVENSKHEARNSKIVSEGELANPGWFAVAHEDLPVKLPKVKKYQPTDTGESPLAAMTKWVNTKCPRCGGPAKRETDTMPNWAGSSWYFIAYCISENLKSQIPISKQITSTNVQNKLKYWMPIDWYNGGMEHTVLHLLYSRFWNRFLYDLGLVPVAEPYKKRTSHGLILGEDGVKISKSRGNVINPDSLVEEFGADALRLYEMFIGPFNQAITWDPRGILGTSRFLERVWKIGERVKNHSEHSDEFARPAEAYGEARVGLDRLLHQTIKKVSEDIESMSFNTAVSAMMIFANKCAEAISVPQGIWEKFLLILAPFAPHMAEELYQLLRGTTRTVTRLPAGRQGLTRKGKTTKFESIHEQAWPEFDIKLITEEKFDLVIQVNGKFRDKVLAERGIDEVTAAKLALAQKEIQKWVSGDKIKKVVFVKNRLINFII